MGPRRDLPPQPMPSQGTALLLSYEDHTKEVRTRTSKAEANVIHDYSFYGKFLKRKNSRSFYTILSNSKKGTRVLDSKRIPWFHPYSRRLSEIEHLIVWFTIE